MKHSVLLVDDTETVLMFEKMMLAAQGFDITVAKNGEEALVKVSEHKPDIILLDIQMPKMDGIEACRHLKANPSTRDIPVVMVTTKGQPDKVEASFMAGCNDYLTKPIDKIELLSKVRTLLG